MKSPRRRRGGSAWWILFGVAVIAVGEGIASASVPQNKLPSTAPLERGV